MKLTTEDVLVYRRGRRPQQTIRRHYLKWREKQDPPIPIRCDNTECLFHNNALVWNDKPLNLILDHKNGVSGDNRPKNLQILCPNCNSQQATHGGRNKGRTEQSEGSFTLKRKDGKKDYVLPTETGKYKITFGQVNVIHQKKK